MSFYVKSKDDRIWVDFYTISSWVLSTANTKWVLTVHCDNITSFTMGRFDTEEEAMEYRNYWAVEMLEKYESESYTGVTQDGSNNNQ